jgi:hypothetical protein
MKEPLRTKDDLDVLSIRTFPYESTVAGTPPVFGATPIKGNGPVKLQTSRRLSSGELLVTTQDHQRTLSDIREGEYIVGRKEPKRISKTISIKFPLHDRASTPRASLALTQQISNSDREQSPRPDRRFSRDHVPTGVSSNKDLGMLEPPASELSPRRPYSRSSSLAKAYILGPAEIPLPMSPGRPPSSRASLLSRGEEQNATIQALWKAEYTRLVAIYGQDGVDRNIAELNKDIFAPSADQKFSLDNSAKKVSSARGASPLPSPDKILPPLGRTSRASVAQEVPIVDNGSDYSSVKVPSLLSSEESSSSYTKRTSLFEADVPTTREEVSRIVENMRKNYLKALEAKSEEKAKAKRPKKAKQRASYAHTAAPGTLAPSKFSKAGRQSWHVTTVPGTTKQEKQSRKRATPKPKTPRESTIAPLKSATSKSSLKMKPPLHRADSTTLGSFFVAKKEEQTPPSPARTLKGPMAEKLHQVAQVDETRPPSNESAASKVSADNVAPEIDDFDIFYQDLAQEFSPTPSNIKPALSEIHVPYEEEIFAKFDDVAPPPPDIDWTPRKRGILIAS